MKSITVSLQSFIDLALDYGRCYNRPLPNYETGLIVHEFVKEDGVYKVQFEEFDGTPLQYPVLWQWKEWYDSSEKWKRDKDRSEKDRVRRWIAEANTKIIAKRLMLVYEFDEAQAFTTASRLLRQGKLGNIRALGVNKLVTKEEELK
jgi:hypothetical protein